MKGYGVTLEVHTAPPKPLLRNPLTAPFRKVFKRADQPSRKRAEPALQLAGVPGQTADRHLLQIFTVFDLIIPIRGPEDLDWQP